MRTGTNTLLSVNEEALPVANARTAGAAGGGGDGIDPPSFENALFWDLKAEVIQLDDYRPGAEAKRRARQGKDSHRMMLMSGARSSALTSRSTLKSDLRAKDAAQHPNARQHPNPANDA